MPGETFVTGCERFQAATQRRHDSARISDEQRRERPSRAELWPAHLKVDGEGVQLDGRSSLRLEIRLALSCGGRHGKSLEIEAEGRAGNSVDGPPDGRSEMTAALLVLEGGQEASFLMVEAGSAQDSDEPLTNANVDISPVADRLVGSE